MTILWAVLLVLLVIFGWALVIFTMPGTWLMVLSSIGYMLVMPPESRLAFGWGVPITLLVLAGLGEVVEMIAGAAGVAQQGGSQRSRWLAIGVSFIGAIVGGILGSAIFPVIGTVIGAVVVACLGAMLGAVLGELWVGRDLSHSVNVGAAAAVGRLLGTVGKVLVATLMVAVILLAMVIQ